MNLTEKTAYIKGLAEGLKLNSETKEGQVLLSIIDVLNDIALTLEDYDETFNDMAEIVSDIEESVYELEEEVFGDENTPDSGYNYDADDSEDFDDLYEVTCAACNKTMTVDADVLDKGSINCPNCGELLEFDLEFLDKEDCDCGCGHDL